MGFMFISLFVFLLAALLIPKRCKPLPLYASIMTANAIEIMIELFLDKKFNRLGYLTPELDYLELLIPYIILPLFCIVYLNMFPYKKSMCIKISYIMLTAAFCTLYEKGAVSFGMLYYNSWKWWYFSLMYPVLLSVLAWNYTWVAERIKFDYEC